MSSNQSLFASTEIELVSVELPSILKQAAQGLEVNTKEIEEKILPLIKENTTSREMLEHLIILALSLTSLQAPDWKYFAGRLRILALYKDCGRQKLYDYPATLAKNIKNGVYTDLIEKYYTKEDIEQAASFINPDFDMIYDYAGASLLIKRYLCEYQDKQAELPQDMFLTIALLAEMNNPKETRLACVKDTYEKLANRKISLATPLLMNLRRPNGNLSSCFITMADDNRDSIFYIVDQISAISKFGGGVGVNISRLRAKGSRIKGIKNAGGGVIPWIRIINDTAVAVNQQGKRKGAVTVALDMWHLDIEDFLELRTENGDQRMKAYDIFPQVVVPDLFMKKIQNNEEWLIVDPGEIRTKYKTELTDLWGAEFETFYEKLYKDAKNGKLELYKFLPAKELMKKIMKSQVETGMPYIAFKDTLNRYNPNKHDGLIVSTNLCTESHSNVRPTKFLPKKLENGHIISEVYDGLVHVCNLISINLANIFSDEELESCCKASVRFLDNAIDLTEVPVPEGTLHNRRYRTIGVGAMGLADHLAYRDITYTNSADYVDELFEKFALYCTKASIDAAAKKGTFEAYKGSDWDKGLIIGKNEEWFKQHSKHYGEWKEVFANLKKYGIRNSQITAIAPNTSSSLIQGCSASILPVYSKFFVETHAKGSIPNCPMYIKEKFWYYQENKNINQQKVVEIISRINKWIDTGISFELIYNLNMDIKAKDIFNTIMLAWQKEIKTLYYTRSIQKDGSSAKKAECISCAG